MRTWTACFLLLLPLAACAPKKAPPPPQTAQETGVEPPPDEVAELIITTSALYEEGLSALIDGDTESARELFDEALMRALECRAGLSGDETLERYLADLIDDIHEVEVQAAEGATAAILAQSDLEKLLLDTLDELDPDAFVAAPSPETSTTEYDMPMVDNRSVDSFVKAFTTRRAHIIGPSLERSTRYLPMMRRIFKEEGVPLDLCYLPLIESGYKVKALSRARAVGLWQFIRGTGRLYDLEINWWLDERRDPEKSTRAAARHLRDLYEEFGDWNLALCAYNAGPGRVRSAIRRGRTRDFWAMARRRLLPRETVGYVPAFMAGLKIAKNPEAHGFGQLDYQQPIPFERLTVDYGVDLEVLAEKANVPPETLYELNPMLIMRMTPGTEPAEIRVPVGQTAHFESALAAIPPEERLRQKRYVLRSGDTLGRLAKRFGTSVRELQTMNGISNPRRLRVGRQILIPIGKPPAGKSTPRRSEQSLPIKKVTHEVVYGDSLYKIAKQYQTTIPSILTLNPGLDPVALQAGQKIELQQGDRLQKKTTTAKRAKRGQPGGAYRVRRGDTLGKIARRHGVSLHALLSANNLKVDSIIRAGQKLRLPTEREGELVVHKVRRGETLSKIAERYQTTVAKLMTWNHLNNRNRLSIGQTILIYR